MLRQSREHVTQCLPHHSHNRTKKNIAHVKLEIGTTITNNDSKSVCIIEQYLRLAQSHQRQRHTVYCCFVHKAWRSESSLRSANDTLDSIYDASSAVAQLKRWVSNTFVHAVSWQAQRAPTNSPWQTSAPLPTRQGPNFSKYQRRCSESIFAACMDSENGNASALYAVRHELRWLVNPINLSKLFQTSDKALRAWRRPPALQGYLRSRLFFPCRNSLPFSSVICALFRNYTRFFHAIRANELSHQTPIRLCVRNLRKNVFQVVIWR